MSSDHPDPRPARAGLWLILAIVAGCAGVELTLLAADYGLLDMPRLRQRAYDNGAFRPQLLQNWIPNYAAQPWLMFLTYGFLHGGPLHMAVNMVTLWSLGRIVVGRIGGRGLALLYLGSILGGAVAYGLISDSLRLMVGASGALFGLAGAMVVWLWNDRDLHDGNLRQMWNLLAYLLVINVVMYWALDGQLAWETHLGGFLIGCALGYTLDPATDDIQADLDPPTPDRLTYVIGDVHGCIQPLNALLQKIEVHRQNRPADLVFVGDYVDRGPDSAAVLKRLMTLDRSPDVTCLLGNHDLMMLRFLEKPDQRSAGWIGAGGQDTLFSFGQTTLPQAPDAAARHRLMAENLRKSMPPDLERWLQTRPLWWQSGNVIVVHALTQPDKPMSEQSDEVLLWARPSRHQAPRSDGTWVVHGHTIVDAPRITPGYIAIDTGAYRGSPLTAVVLGNGAPEFLQATSAVEIAAQTG